MPRWGPLNKEAHPITSKLKPPIYMEEIKIIIAGPVGAGKTTAMRTVFGNNLLAGEAKYTAAEVDDVKGYTTVSMDYGTLNDMHSCSERPVKLHVYSIPGQERFKFMWEILSKNAHGLILLVAAGERNIFSVISNYLSVVWPYMHNEKAVLVALNKIPENFFENINIPEYLYYNGTALRFVKTNVTDKSEVLLLFRHIIEMMDI